jgi:3',5'-cyclic AMP phosphodiesterase CpdA
MDLTFNINSWAGYAVILFALCVLTLLVYELWQDLRQYLDDYWVDKLRHSNPQHLNSEAIQRIQKHIDGRTDFRFAVIGDTQKSFVSFKKILKRAHEDNYDFIIHLGDFTSSGRYTQYTKMLQFIKSNNVPVVCGIGNHDISNRGPECFAHFFGPLNYYFDIGNYRFIFINNNKKEFTPDAVALPGTAPGYKRQRGMEEEQVNYLEALIQGSEHNFIFIHTPPNFTNFKHHSFTRNSERFTNLMKLNATKIAGVFSGHIHGYAELLSDGVQYIVSGGAGKKLHASRDGITNNFNYVLMRIERDNVTHQVNFID